MKDTAPSLPGVVLSGLIWPPLTGRDVLSEALSSASTETTAATSLGHGAWVLTEAHGWRLHSPGSAVDVDEARTSLLAWASVHARAQPWISHRRCVLVADDDEIGWRLWQVVAPAPTLWAHVSAAIELGDPTVIAAAVTDAVRVCRDVGTRWSSSPLALPCTLETVGLDGLFVALMPTLEALLEKKVTPEQLRARLLRQLSSLLKSSLGTDIETWLDFKS